MKKALVSFLCVAMAGLVRAEAWETATEPSNYGVTFADYDEGEVLSNKGAKGGAWSDLSEATTAARTLDGRKCMTCESSNLLFKPSSSGLNGPKVSKASVYITGSLGLPALDTEKDKAALAIRIPSDDTAGKPVFVGWSASGWQDLYAETIEPMTNTWYDIAVWSVVNVDNRPQVQYRVKTGDAYVPLHTKAGEVWLDSGVQGGDPIMREVEVVGTGAFDLLSGRELPAPGVSVHGK